MASMSRPQEVRPGENPAPKSRTVEDYLGVATTNLAHLIGLYPLSEAVRATGLSDQGLANIRNGKPPTLRNALRVVTRLGSDPADLFMPPALFAEKWTGLTVDPPAEPPRPLAIVNSPSCDGSMEEGEAYNSGDSSFCHLTAA